jgi:hypothetical protein
LGLKVVQTNAWNPKKGRSVHPVFHLQQQILQQRLLKNNAVKHNRIVRAHTHSILAYSSHHAGLTAAHTFLPLLAAKTVNCFLYFHEQIFARRSTIQAA